MEANDIVKVVNPDGRTLTNAAVKYDNATNTISTDVPFTFDRGRSISRATASSPTPTSRTS